jgi:RecB family exonuclease
MSASRYQGDYLSVSRAKLAEKCLLAFRFRYVDRLPQVPSAPAEFGKLCHAALQFVFDWVVDEEFAGLLPDSVVLASYRRAFEQSSVNGLAVYREGLGLVRSYCQRAGKIDHRRVLAVEKKFNVDLGDGCVAYGFMDRVDRLDDDVVEVIDYKTNRMLFSRDEVDSDLQMSVYGIAAKKLWPWAKEVVFKFEMLRHSFGMRTERSAEELADARDYLVSLNSRLHALKQFPATLNSLCGWCDYRDRCPAFSEAVAGDGLPSLMCSEDIEEVVSVRAAAAAAEKAAKGRRYEMDDILKPRLAELGGQELSTEKWKVSLRSSQETYRPVLSTLRELERASSEFGMGLSPLDLADAVTVVDNARLKRFLNEASISSSRRQVLSVRLDTVSRTTAKRPFVTMKKLGPKKT